MARKKYKHSLVHTYFTYKIPDIVRLFIEVKLHDKTIREWIKSGKLKAFQHEGEWYVYGGILKSFLQTKREQSKKTLSSNQFRCKNCKTIDTPKNNIITKLTHGRNGSLLAIGVCNKCGLEKTQRPYKRIYEEEIRKIFIIKIDEVMTLCKTSISTNNTHLKIEEKITQSEPYQKPTIPTENPQESLIFQKQRNDTKGKTKATNHAQSEINQPSLF